MGPKKSRVIVTKITVARRSKTLSKPIFITFFGLFGCSMGVVGVR